MQLYICWIEYNNGGHAYREHLHYKRANSCNFFRNPDELETWNAPPHYALWKRADDVNHEHEDRTDRGEEIDEGCSCSLSILILTRPVVYTLLWYHWGLYKEDYNA